MTIIPDSFLPADEYPANNEHAMHPTTCRLYVTYSGVKLPLKLVNPLEQADIANRNTYFRAWFDERERMVLCQKVVYGEVEMQHRYEYHDNGRLRLAEITEADDPPRVMRFDEHGELLA